MKSKNFSVFENVQNFYSKQPLVLRTFETIESTNTFAKNEALNIPETQHVYVALRQTKGRGRGERTWLESEAQPTSSDQLFITWSFSLPSSPQPIAAPLIGLLIHQALQTVWPSSAKNRWGLKPPNDLYLENKKVAGLLVETIGDGRRSRLIVGLGLNVFSHPSNVQESGSLASQYEIQPDDFQKFLAAIEKKWPEILKQVQSQTLLASVKPQLLQALNSCQVNPRAILEVTDRCDLITETATLSWRNL